MKKIFTLLLLGGLLLVGAEKVWGDSYTVVGSKQLTGLDWNVAATGNEMTESSGTYTLTRNLVYLESSQTHGFKVVKNHNYSNGSWPSSNYSVSIASSGWYNLVFTYKTSDNSVSCTATAASPTLHSVVIKLSGMDANSSKLYAFDQDNGDYGNSAGYLGEWPGADANSSNQWSVSVPDGKTLQVIFHNGSGTQSVSMKVGQIKNDNLSFTYTLNDFNANAMVGSFNDWCFNDFFSSGSLTMSLGATTTYQFKVVDGRGSGSDAWYSLTPSNGTITADNSAKNQYNNNSNSELTTTIAGDYTFTWSEDGGNKLLTVGYPDEYTRTGLAGSFGTICLPVKISSVTNATLYTISSFNESGTGVILSDPGTYTAGEPYIYKLDAGKSSFTVTLDNKSYSATPGSGGGLVGSYTGTSVTAGNYVIYNNQIAKAISSVSIDEFRAYIVKEDISSYKAPGVRFLEIPLAQDNTTNLEVISTSEKATKIFEDGYLFIIRDGIKYDATGRVVK